MELSENTAPIEISFGYEKNGMCMTGLVIKKAPSSVIKSIIADERTFIAHLEIDGLHVEGQLTSHEKEYNEES